MMGLRRFAAALGLAALVGCASAPKDVIWADGSADFRGETGSYGVPRLYASAMQAYGVFDPVSVLRYYDLNIAPRDAVKFVDTDKPNAVALFPLVDGVEIFSEPEVRDILGELRERYDLAVRVVSNEDAALVSIREVPDPSLLLLAGHGTDHAIALGAASPDEVEWSQRDERLYLDRTDTDLWREVGELLTDDAVVFMYSCSTGEGRDGAKNLANDVRTLTGKRVIGASMPVNLPILDSALPFEARLISCTRQPFVGMKCLDATYEPK